MKISKIILAVSLTLGMGMAGMAQKAGTIVFSRSPVNPEAPSGLSSSFKAGDPIYAAAFFPKPIRELAAIGQKSKAAFDIAYKIDYWRTTSGELQGSVLDNNFLAFEIVPNPQTAISYAGSAFIYKKHPNLAACDGPIRIASNLTELEEGINRIEVQLKLNYQVVASGAFEIEGNDFSMYMNMAKALASGADEAALKNTRLPQAKMKDKSLESTMRTALLNSNDWKNGRLKGRELLQLVIVDSEWHIRRHEITGAILHRYIRAAITTKDAGGKCWMYPLVTFQQDYSSGNWQAVKYDGAGDANAIECAHAN